MSTVFYILAMIWTLIGLTIGVYVKWETLTRKRREAGKRAKEVGTSVRKNTASAIHLALQTAFLLAGFAIPIAVTVITYVFSS